jgi:hypothetical protein
MVTESAEFKIDKVIPPFEPYKLDNSCLKLPTELYIDFIAKDNIRYVYEIGFTATKIMYENLKFYPKSQPATLIERKYGVPIKYGEYLPGRKKDIEDKLYENQLFLSKVSTDKLEGLTSAYLFFSEGIYVSTFHDTKYDNLLIQTFTNKMAKDDIPFFKENINNLMQVADTGIDCIDIKEIEIDTIKFESLLFLNCANFTHHMPDSWVEQMRARDINIEKTYYNSTQIRLNGELIIKFDSPVWRWHTEKLAKA